MEPKLRLGDILVEKNIITHEQLMQALNVQKQSSFSKKLGEIFIEEGLISEKDLAVILASQLGYSFLDLYSVDIDFSVLKNYSLNLLKNADAIIFKEDDDFIHITVADPLNVEAIESLENIIII